MKKVAFMFVAALAMSLVSCGGKTKACGDACDSTACDSTAIEEAVVDTNDTDTIPAIEIIEAEVEAE